MFDLIEGNTHALIEIEEGHVIPQEDFLDIQQSPLCVNTERILVFKGKAKRAKIIDFGSEWKCHESFAVFQQSTLRRLDSNEIQKNCQSVFK